MTASPQRNGEAAPSDIGLSHNKSADMLAQAIAAHSEERSEPADAEKDDSAAGHDDTPVPIGQTDRNDVMATIREVFADGQPRDRDTAIRDIADALGYQRVGKNIRDTLDDDIRTAVRRGILENEAGQIRLLAHNISQYAREHLIDMLLAAIGGGWWRRDKAIQSAARHMGFRRTGSTIVDCFKSAINGAIRRGLLEYEGERIRRRS